VSWTEIAGFVTGAACVWLVIRENTWNWPVGIANNVFYLVLFLQVGLYADAGLQIFFVGLAAHGWAWWLRHGTDHGTRVVQQLSGRHAAAVAAGTATLTAALWLALNHATDSTVPFWDALTTSLSLAAQYLLTRKYIENWFLWMAADVIYVALYVYKDLWLTAVLYLGFLGLCVIGLRAWTATRRQTQDPVVVQAALSPS
jgi:nicotinamide mononucleotide transporter